MPSNSDFKVEVLIADTPVPEYEKNGEHFIECNLSTPISYKLKQTDVVGGEREVQNWPVTPYKIKLVASPTSDVERSRYFRILVDGVKVKGVSLEPGEPKTIKGFRDGPCIREFLFSMPRFAKDHDDRIELDRRPAVGKIVIECWNATLRRSQWALRQKYLDFKQANKKDSSMVTDGNYTMATSCAGKIVSGRAVHRLVDSWKLQTLRSSVTIKYHMGHTLREMGFTLQPLNIPAEMLRALQQRNSNDDTKVKPEPVGTEKKEDIIVVDLTAEDDDNKNAVKIETHKYEKNQKKVANDDDDDDIMIIETSTKNKNEVITMDEAENAREDTIKTRSEKDDSSSKETPKSPPVALQKHQTDKISSKEKDASEKENLEPPIEDTNSNVDMSEDSSEKNMNEVTDKESEKEKESSDSISESGMECETPEVNNTSQDLNGKPREETSKCDENNQKEVEEESVENETMESEDYLTKNTKSKESDLQDKRTTCLEKEDGESKGTAEVSSNEEETGVQAIETIAEKGDDTSKESEASNSEIIDADKSMETIAEKSDDASKESEASKSEMTDADKSKDIVDNDGKEHEKEPVDYQPMENEEGQTEHPESEELKNSNLPDKSSAEKDSVEKDEASADSEAALKKQNSDSVEEEDIDEIVVPETPTEQQGESQDKNTLIEKTIPNESPNENKTVIPETCPESNDLADKHDKDDSGFDSRMTSSQSADSTSSQDNK